MENTMPKITNSACLEGEIANEITQFENKGEVFYEFKLDVSRLSGTVDTIPVTISKNLVNSRSIALKEGTTLNLRGEFRSRNAQENGASHLHLFFFAKDILPPTKEKCNNVYLHGFLCKPPVFRETPFKRQINDILLAVNRPFFKKSDYIPLIAWGRNALFAKNFRVGDKVGIVGRIQSRRYNKVIDDVPYEKTAYEVSIQDITNYEEKIESHLNYDEPGLTF